MSVAEFDKKIQEAVNNYQSIENRLKTTFFVGDGNLTLNQISCLKDYEISNIENSLKLKKRLYGFLTSFFFILILFFSFVYFGGGQLLGFVRADLNSHDFGIIKEACLVFGVFSFFSMLIFYKYFSRYMPELFSIKEEGKKLYTEYENHKSIISNLNNEKSNWLKSNKNPKQRETAENYYKNMHLPIENFAYTNAFLQHQLYITSEDNLFHINFFYPERYNDYLVNDVDFKNLIDKILRIPRQFKLKDDEFYYHVYIVLDESNLYNLQIFIRGVNGFVDIKKINSSVDNIEGFTSLKVSGLERINSDIATFYLSSSGSVSSHDLPDFVDFKADMLKKGYIYFGESSSGSFYIDISKMTHFLVVGVSGTGKSVFLNNLITSIRYNQDMFNNICLADLKGGVEFFPYSNAGIKKLDIVDGLESLREVVKKYLNIMRSNLESMKQRGLKKWDGGFELLLIDEYSLIQLYKPTEKEEKASHQQLLSHLNILSAQGRAAGIRLVVGLQKATTDNMDSSFKNNLQSQVCFRVKNSLDVVSIFGSADFREELGVNPLNFGKGRCFLYDDSIQEYVLVQVPFYDDNKIYHFND